MKKSDVTKVMGKPDEYRGSVRNDMGNVVSVWQYRLYDGSVAFTNFALGFIALTVSWWMVLPNQGSNYWLYFVEDQLAQWGQAGDWREDLIMKIKMEQK